MTVKIRLDGKEYEEGSQAHLDKIDEVHRREVDKLKAEAKADAEKIRLDAKAEADKLTADLATEKKRADTAEGRADSAEASLETFKTDAKKSEEKAAEERAKALKMERSKQRTKVRLVSDVARFFGNDEDEDDDEEDDEDDDKDKDDKDKKKKKKFDAKLDSLLDMSERDLMLKAIQTAQPKFDATDESDDYVQARYDSLLERVKSDRGIDGVRRAVEEQTRRLDNNDSVDDDNDPVTKARKARDKATRDAWKTTTPNGGV